KHNLTQISLTDPDCRLMKNKNGMDTAYNVQTAVDTETHLMMDYQMTNRNTDHGLMASTMEEIKKGAGDEIIEVLADKGYQQPEDMIECLEKGIIPNVILPDGQETYELEIEYEEKGCDKSSKSTEEIKKCLHNGSVPDVYEEVIEKIEVVETKKKVVDEPAEMAEPYA
ncbi:transposase, partial [Clostridium sp. 1xD42-85]|uniref:transposase n=1 Tax=Clostridium sp. 1xD42-85 TaxID=2320084 RepID=UPI000EC88C7B